MISWLQGKVIDIWDQGAKKGIVLACNGVGYEVQLSTRHLIEIENYKILSLWIHLSRKEEGDSLFGFLEKDERDMFRKIITVNGVGPKIALSLVEKYRIDELIPILKNRDIQKLTQAKGIGKRMAERVALELYTKVNEFDDEYNIIPIQANQESDNNVLGSSNIKDIQNTLEELGYEAIEINTAIKAVASLSLKDDSKGEPPSNNTEKWLKEILMWLSKEQAA